MSEDDNRADDAEMKSFAELMETYQRGRGETIRLGDRISGKIISIGRDAVFIDTGTKVDGVVEKAEFLDENGLMPYAVGDVLDLYVVSSNGDEVRLSKGMSRTGGMHALRSAFQKSVPVEGKVKGVIKGGFHVEILGRKAFCPTGQIDLGFTETPEEHVGKTYLFLISRFEEGGRNIVVSRRELLRAEQAKSREAFLKDLTPGSHVDGRVTKLMPYGVFVELFPGVEGMVHISELSWSRLSKPEEAVNRDDVIRVKIIDMEGSQGKKPGRIALSVKQVTGDPWENLGERFRTGDRLVGRVTRCTSFGAFVELEPGVEGLVHVSEMSYRKRVTKPEDFVAPGDRVQVMIKEMDPARRRIGLSMKEVEGDPWVDAGERFQVGLALQGVIERKEKFGCFVSLEPGITGLVPKSRITESGSPGLFDRLKEGDSVNVLIEAVLPKERKITLALSDLSGETDWRGYTGKGGKSLGSLGERLQDALRLKGEGDRE
ncbi:MAG: 30S ribosomal protein S1 [Thermodesulfobacteriota bacterium]